MSLARSLLADASRPYLAAGWTQYFAARSKLLADPVFEAILSRGLLSSRARILDLGCGQGLLAALLLAARAASASRAWPDHWPPAPEPSLVRGIEIVARQVRKARLALTLRPEAASHTEFIHADVCGAEFGCADGVVILDVLQFIEPAQHRSILERAHRALLADGVLLLRIGNAAGGVRFRLGKWVDRISTLARRRALHYRSTQEWLDLLLDAGFDAEAVPMSAGTPFANVLLIARPRAGGPS
jgi:SAM-dependent methyltransferase